MKLKELIQRIKNKGNIWEVAYKISTLSVLIYIALTLTSIRDSADSIDGNIETTQSDVTDIQSTISNIESDITDIKSDISDIESNTSK
jgi:peptidoglycan hydrolase CwlO-like protein